MKLILFDIDGTIMDSGGAGTRSLDLAFSELFSINNAFRDIAMAGKTDLQILREGISKHRLPADNGAVPAAIEAYLKNLKREILNDRKHLKPGVREALEELRKAGDRYITGLLTGNVREGARIKLEAFDLASYFPSGAFGDDHEDRNRLLPVAVKRFEEITGNSIEHRRCVIIGDTPRDVHCAKPYGASTIAVATGSYDKKELAEAGAEVVMDDLSRTDLLMEALGDL